MLDLTYRRRLLEAILDFFLIGIAYYFSFLVQNGLTMTQASLGVFLDTLPLVLAGTFLALMFFGIYRAIWRFTSYDDVLRYATAAIGSAFICAALIFGVEQAKLSTRTEPFAYITLVYYGVALFIGLAVSRSSFRLLDAILKRPQLSSQESVLIIGAGESGEMALRWILMNPALNLRPVGFVDPDLLLRGRSIHGVRVLGDLSSLPELLSQRRISGLILAVDELPAGTLDHVAELCLLHGCWLRKLRLEFESLPVQEIGGLIT